MKELLTLRTLGIILAVALLDLWTLPGTQHVSGGFILVMILAVVLFVKDWRK